MITTQIPQTVLSHAFMADIDTFLDEMDIVDKANCESVEQSNHFTQSNDINKPAIFLNDFGNIRLFWCNDQNEQVGLQFLGNNQIQYVIFSMKNSLELNTCHGRTHVNNIYDIITANGLKDLVYYSEKRTKPSPK